MLKYILLWIEKKKNWEFRDFQIKALNHFLCFSKTRLNDNELFYFSLFKKVKLLPNIRLVNCLVENVKFCNNNNLVKLSTYLSPQVDRLQILT